MVLFICNNNNNMDVIACHKKDRFIKHEHIKIFHQARFFFYLLLYSYILLSKIVETMMIERFSFFQIEIVY